MARGESTDSSEEAKPVVKKSKQKKGSESKTDNTVSSKKRTHKVSSPDSDEPPESPVKISKIDFMHLIKDFKTRDPVKLHVKGKLNFQKFAEMLAVDEHKELMKQPTFETDFMNILRTAMHRKHMALDTMIHVIDQYLSDGSSVEDFPEFPHPPKRPIDSYISANRTKQSSLTDYVSMRKEYASGNVDTKPYVEEHVKQCKAYLEALESYLKNNQDRLLQSHIDHVHDLIRKYQKSSSSSPKKVVERKKKTKKTAFDWYKDSVKDSYTDMDEEKREKKLFKKFQKLDEASKQIYENIAAANN